MREIVIVGGGAGAVLVVDALRRVRSKERWRVLVYEGRHRPGRGVPYRTADPAHRMNVPVGRLSVDPTDPDHLLRWLRAEGQAANPAEYIARGVYGRYLEAVLAGTAVDRRLVDVQVVASPVVGIARTDTGLEVLSTGAPPALASEVVLAVGAPPAPTPLPIDPELCGDPAVVSDPWAPGALGGGPRRWLVAGTGLTMIDVALTALRRPGTTVDAFSRHGELPRAHPGRRTRSATPIDVPHGRLTASGLGRVLRDHAAVEPNGWQASVDLFRDRSGEIRPRLSEREQAKVLRRIGQWNVHRHRTSPQVGRELDRAIASGRLRIHAGHVEELRRSEDGTDLTARLRHRGCTTELRGDRFVACTGPPADVGRTDDPLVRQLLDSGLARVGPHRLGLAVDGCGRAIDADGRVVEGLTVLGALRKGTVFETTAIPELRDQAADLAARLAG